MGLSYPFYARTATNGESIIRMLKDGGYDGYWGIERNINISKLNGCLVWLSD